MATTSAASIALKRLSINTMTNMNISKDLLFKRAIKVFHVSYYAYNSMAGEAQRLYKQYFDEYCAIMTQVFQPIRPINDVMNAIETELKSEKVQLTIGVIKAKNMDISDKKIMLIIEPNIPDVPPRDVFSLNPTVEQQKQLFFSANIKFEDFVKLKTESKVCKISLTVKSQTESIDIPYDQIHSEGFVDWHNFMGVELLIRISIGHTEGMRQEAQGSHIASIDHIIRYRLSQSVDTTKANFNRLMSRWHNSVAAKRNIEPLRKLTPPESSLAFWSKPGFDNKTVDERTLELMRSDLTYGRKAQYHDLNIDLFGDSFEDKPFCVCNEWCNLGAFYYHNPVLRFYMIKHNMLYITNPSVVPNYYLAIICHQMTFPSPADIVFRPLFQLMRSAFKYCEDRNDRANREPEYKALFANTFPPVNYINGVIYNILRDQIHPKLAVITSEAPFSDTSIENIRTYYKILNYYHEKIGSVQQFVKADQLNDWYKELETLSRNWYHNYIDSNFKDVLSGNQALILEDYLFSRTDIYETEIGFDHEIHVLRQKIRNYDNPLNPKFANKPFLSSLIQLIRFLLNVEPFLLKPRKLAALRVETQFAVALDELLCQISLIPDFIQNYSIASILNAENMSAQKQTYFTLFYTLKIYSNAYRLQKYFFHYISKSNAKGKGGADTTYMPVSMAFIFRTNWIEGSMAVVRPTEPILFETGCQPLKGAIDEFYDQFWPKEAHETQPKMSSILISDSVLNHYNRHYLWIKNNGNNKNVFQNIFATFQQLITDSIKTTETIFLNQIINNCKEFVEQKESKDDYITEVVDQLVLYLIKSVCYTMIGIVAHLLGPIHGLINSQMVRKNQSFTLCKPGFVQLLNTSRLCYQCIDRLKDSYLIYDDENDSIVETLSETRVNIKSLYRTLYRQLTIDWAVEVENIHNNWLPLNANQDNKYADVMRLHVANGLSFLALFIDDFRKESRKIRHHLNKIYKRKQPMNITQNAFLDSWRLGSEQYLKNKQEVSSGETFKSQIWTQLLQNIITRFDTKQPSDLNIDLTNIQ